MNKKKMILSVLLVFCLVLGVCPALVRAEHSDEQIGTDNTGNIVWTTETNIEEFEMPASETSALAIRFFSVEDYIPSLAPGNHEKWIDRVVLPDYAIQLYDFLESDLLTENSILINPEKGQRISTGYYGIVVKEFSETGKLDDVDDAISLEEFKKLADQEIAVIKNENLDSVKPSILAAYNAFDRDHPEVFWLTSNCSTGQLVKPDYDLKTKTYSFTQTIYFFSKTPNFDVRAEAYQNVAKIEQDIALREQCVQKILQTVSNDSCLEQIADINYWLTSHNEYNALVHAGNQDAAKLVPTAWECISALEGRSGNAGPVCEGYARAFQVLCKKLEIPCVLVDGYARARVGATPGPHMWNYVKMEDGKWYAVDVTWNDPSGSNGEGTENWLLVGSETVQSGLSFLNSHPVNNTVSSSAYSVSFKNGPVLNADRYALEKPSFRKIQNGSSYCENASFAVRGDRIVSVTVDGEEISPVGKEYTIIGDDAEHTVVAENAAGDKKEIKITVYAAHTDSDPKQENLIIDKENMTITWEENVYCAVCEELISSIEKSVDYPCNPIFHGVEDGQVYCGSVAFTVTGENVTSVSLDGEELVLVDGIYQIIGDGNSHELTAVNSWGEATTLTITIWEAHQESAAVVENWHIDKEQKKVTWDEVVYCEHCGEELSREPQMEDYPGDPEIVDAADGTPLTDGTVLCGEAIFCVNGESIISVQIDGVEGTAAEGIYTIAGDGQTHRIIAENKWNESKTVQITVNVHVPGNAKTENVVINKTAGTQTYDEVVYCTICGEELQRITNTAKYSEEPEPTPEPTPQPTPQPTPVQPEKVGSEIENKAANASFEVTRSDKDRAEVTYAGPINDKVSNVVIPDTVEKDGIVYEVTAISPNAFKNNKKIKRATIGSNIIKIGKNAFSGCKNLKTITINSLNLTTKNVGSKAFKNISSKAVIKVPAKKYKEYKKLLKAKGVGSKVKIRKK